MKPTDEILSLLENRRRAGEVLSSYDYQVHRWCESNGVDVSDIARVNGCMLISEPMVYEELFLQRINDTE